MSVVCITKKKIPVRCVQRRPKERSLGEAISLKVIKDLFGTKRFICLYFFGFVTLRGNHFVITLINWIPQEHLYSLFSYSEIHKSCCDSLSLHFRFPKHVVKFTNYIMTLLHFCFPEYVVKFTNYVGTLSFITIFSKHVVKFTNYVWTFSPITIFLEHVVSFSSNHVLCWT